MKLRASHHPARHLQLPAYGLHEDVDAHPPLVLHHYSGSQTAVDAFSRHNHFETALRERADDRFRILRRQQHQVDILCGQLGVVQHHGAASDQVGLDVVGELLAHLTKSAFQGLPAGQYPLGQEPSLLNFSFSSPIFGKSGGRFLSGSLKYAAIVSISSSRPYLVAPFLTRFSARDRPFLHHSINIAVFSLVSRGLVSSDCSNASSTVPRHFPTG